MDLRDVEAALGANVDDPLVVLAQLPNLILKAKDLHTSLKATLIRVRNIGPQIKAIPNLVDAGDQVQLGDELRNRLNRVRANLKKLNRRDAVPSVDELLKMLGGWTPPVQENVAEQVQENEEAPPPAAPVEEIAEATDPDGDITLQELLDEMHTASVNLLHSVVNSPGQIISVAQFVLDLENNIKKLKIFFKDATIWDWLRLFGSLLTAFGGLAGLGMFIDSARKCVSNNAGNATFTG